MFCDLDGSTELASRLDPEDMGAVMRAYHTACQDVVTRWGGHVAKYMGDGMLAYFGYPHAHEDDAERAVRAGIDLAAAIEGLKSAAACAGRRTAGGGEAAGRVRAEPERQGARREPAAARQGPQAAP